MNKQRRKEISNLVNELENFILTLDDEDSSKIVTGEELNTIADFASQIEDVKNEEEDCLSNIPDNLQSSERYSVAEEAVNNLESALDYLYGIDDSTTVESCIESLQSAVSGLEDAAQ